MNAYLQTFNDSLLKNFFLKVSHKLLCVKHALFYFISDNNDNASKSKLLTEDEIFIGGLILHNLQFLQFNAHEVSELEIKDDNINKTESIFLGGAIYPTLSMFNHSCNPAIVRYFLVLLLLVNEYLFTVKTVFKKHGTPSI